MQNVHHILTLFRAFREGNSTAFYKAAETLISDELAANHHSVAQKMKKALGSPESSSKKSYRLNSLSSLPKDRRSGEELISVEQSAIDVSRIVFAEETRRHLDRLLDEHRQRLRLAKHGYRPKSKLLFWGPPGCGKTLTAHYLAQELNLPVSLVRLSAIISSFLGDTASNIQRVFDIAASTPMVLLLDEIDTIGKSRDDSNDIGELKRIVNSLLQAIDSFHSNDGIIIAASNHQYLLDSAIWRRLDDVIYFPLPGNRERTEFLKFMLNGVKYNGSFDNLTKNTASLSFSDLERIVIESIKTMILERREILQNSDISAQINQHKKSLKAMRLSLEKKCDEQ